MKKKKPGVGLEERTRAKVADCLPAAIDHAVQSYRGFYLSEVEDDARAFSAHHAACKTAIAHIELLLKLASWAQLPRANEDGQLAGLLADAKSELARYKEDEDEDEA